MRHFAIQFMWDSESSLYIEKGRSRRAACRELSHIIANVIYYLGRCFCLAHKQRTISDRKKINRLIYGTREHIKHF